MTKRREEQVSGGAGRGKDEEFKTEIGMQEGRKFREAAKRRAMVLRVGDVLQSRVVAVLPEGLWRPGNLYLGMRLHFCVGGEPDRAVRAAEWNGREVARGRKAVDRAALGGDADG